MKKLVPVLLFALFVVNILHAQTSEALTNTIIIKMVKAKLSDDLIIDEINNSKVNFNVSIDSIKFLSNENVSNRVIEEMKVANGIQTPNSIKESITQKNPQEQKEPLLNNKENSVQPPTIPVKENMKQPSKEQMKSDIFRTKKLSIETTKTENGTIILIEKPEFTINAISYVTPMKELITFFNNEFTSLGDIIRDWDRQIRVSLERERHIMDTITMIDKVLTAKKNADAKAFNKEIIYQKSKLVRYWEKHNLLKNEMVTNEKNLIEALKNTSKETDNSIEEKFKEVSKNVRKTHPEPSIDETANEIIIPKQKFNSKIITYFAPITMILTYYQNEIISLQDYIEFWNGKAIDLVQKDSELNIRLKPLENELSQYLSTTKQNQKLKKKEISALKKQCDNITKERKQLAKKMLEDSEKLSDDLNKMRDEVKGAVMERFMDAIENIEHSYQYKF